MIELKRGLIFDRYRIFWQHKFREKHDRNLNGICALSVLTEIRMGISIVSIKKGNTRVCPTFMVGMMMLVVTTVVFVIILG